MNTKTKTLSPTAPAKPAPSGLAFELTLDSDNYVSPNAGQIEATLMLRANAQSPLALSFFGQQFDLEIRDASGALVSRWSEGRSFSDLAQTVEVTGPRIWKGSLPVPATVRPVGPILPEPIMPEPIMPGPVAVGSSGPAPVPPAPMQPDIVSPVGGTGVMPIIKPPGPTPEPINLAPVSYTLTGYLMTGGASAASAQAVRPYSATVAFTVQPRPVLEMSPLQ